MQNRDKVNQYLSSFELYLARLNQFEAKEVLREIESHIYDSIESAQEKDSPLDIDEILSGFGKPRELAAQYVEHILEGTAPPKGFSTIVKVKQGATSSLYWATALLGYIFGGALVILGLLKILMPSSVGVWSAAEGKSIIVGYVGESTQYGDEIAGFWLIPIAIICGLVLLKLTFSILQIIKRSRGKME